MFFTSRKTYFILGLFWYKGVSANLLFLGRFSRKTTELKQRINSEYE